MFERIVAIVDGAAASQPAVDAAAALARQFASDLVGIFVVDGGWAHG